MLLAVSQCLRLILFIIPSELASVLTLELGRVDPLVDVTKTQEVQQDGQELVHQVD